MQYLYYDYSINGIGTHAERHTYRATKDVRLFWGKITVLHLPAQWKNSATRPRKMADPNESAVLTAVPIQQIDNERIESSTLLLQVVIIVDLPKTVNSIRCFAVSETLRTIMHADSI